MGIPPRDRESTEGGKSEMKVAGRAAALKTASAIPSFHNFAKVECKGKKTKADGGRKNKTIVSLYEVPKEVSGNRCKFLADKYDCIAEGSYDSIPFISR